MRDRTAESVRASFERQAAACRDLGSPFTAWLCETLIEALDPTSPLGARVLDWPGDPTAAGDAVALRLCGGLQAIALAGEDAALAALFGAAEPSTAGRRAVAGALDAHAAKLDAALDRAPQTNEVARTAAIWPALRLVAARTGLPLALWELGASAGLALSLDRFAYRLGTLDAGTPGSSLRLAPDWRGPPPGGVEPVIAEATGCDLAPIDPTEAAARRRLRSYVWADQPERRARLDAALAIAAARPPRVERADAVDWLARRLALPCPGLARVVFSTIAWQYLPPARRTAGEAAIRAAGARACATAPLAWVRFEADGGAPGAGLTLDLWPGGRHERLARGDFHGRWVVWHASESFETTP